MSSFTRSLPVLLLFCGAHSTAPAAAFPDRPVRVVVPFASGGGTDIVARILAQDISASWGQPVIMDNRGGAGGNVGTELVAQAAPDGHTLLLTTAAIAIAPSIYKRLSYDPLKDFVAISKVGYSPAVVLVHQNVRASSVPELVALAKAQPGKLNYGSSGAGGSLHLATELFKTKAKVDIVHIPYKGAALALNDLAGGQIQFMLNAMGTGLALAKSGRVKVLAVTTATRSSFAPELPTVVEGGVPYEFSYWYGVFAPAKTPPAIVAQLNRDIGRVLETPATRKRLESQSVTAAPSSLVQFGAEVRDEVRVWAEVAKASGIQPE